MSVQIEVKDLSIIFQHQQEILPVVAEVNWSIAAGETLALLGESGCGKSVMAQALMRLLPNYAYYHQASRIVLQDLELLNLPLVVMQSLRGKRLGMVFQEPMTALNPVLTIKTQLAEVFMQHGHITSAELDARLIQALEEVELDDPKIRLHQYPHQLSGGQKQRVVIAMALANHPEVLIADEPTTALDVTIQAQILHLLKRLQSQRTMSVLLITHDLGVVKAMAHRVCVMYAGEVIEMTDTKTFFDEIRHPYIQQLLASKPSFEGRTKELLTIPGRVPHLTELPSGCRFHPRCAHAMEVCRTEHPVLLDWIHGNIRCHLYAQGKTLPALAEPKVREPQNLSTSPQTAQPILQADDLHVDFKIKDQGLGFHHHWLHAVNGVSFALYPQQTLAIVGESGSGKTTLSRALLGLYPLCGGKILFQGEDLTQLTRRQWHHYRKNVQMVFQDPFTSLDPHATIAEILAEGMLAHGKTQQEIQKKQRELLDQVQLPLKSLNQYPHEFSGGQRQRISIARALSTEPSILICDEPTSALDMSIQAQILNLFQELQGIYGLSYLFITHNMSVVAYLADEVLVMKEGRMIECGGVEQIFKHPRHTYTKELLHCVL